MALAGDARMIDRVMAQAVFDPHTILICEFCQMQRNNKDGRGT
jgi:hypothetical protein